MSKFISVSCCLIVGLELLIGVPLAVVVAYAYGAASVPVQVSPASLTDTGYVPSPYAYSAAPLSPAPNDYASSPYAGPPTPVAAAPCKPSTPAASPATCEPASAHPVPLAFAPSALPMNPSSAALPQATYNPYVATPPKPGLCPAPAVAWTPATSSLAKAWPVLPVAPSNEVPANRVASAQISDDAPAGGEASSDSQSESAAAAPAAPQVAAAVQLDPAMLVSSEDLHKLVADWQKLWSAGSDMPALAAKICSSGECPLAMAVACEAPACETLACETAAAESYTEQSLRNALQRTVHELYAQAERAEGNGDFKRADHLRELARSLRLEVVDLSLREQVSEKIDNVESAESAN